MLPEGGGGGNRIITLLCTQTWWTVDNAPKLGGQWKMHPNLVDSGKCRLHLYLVLLLVNGVGNREYCVVQLLVMYTPPPEDKRIGFSQWPLC